MRTPVLLLLVGLQFCLACSDSGPGGLTPYVPQDSAEPELPSHSILPDALDPVVTARLTYRWEGKHFIVHMEPGDSVDVVRMEAYHSWAASYLGITLPKKIDYYKFRTVDDLEEAFGRRPGGVAFPEATALATWMPWHNHEAFHIYLYLFRGEKPTTRFFDEGMVVAHEFDPLNHDWVARQTRREPHYAHLERVLEYRTNGFLYPVESIMESAAFNAAMESEALAGTGLVSYSQAGMFVAFLIEKYGLEKMREVMVAVGYSDSLHTIRIHFQQLFGLSIQDAEAAWLAWLDALDG